MKYFALVLCFAAAGEHGVGQRVEPRRRRLTNNDTVPLQPYTVSEECKLDKYYSSIQSIIDSNLNGTALNSVLHNHIDDHIVIDGSAGTTWDALAVLDALNGDPSTGKVTLLYKQTAVDVNMANDKDGWIRQKLIPPSYGVGTMGPDVSDLFNLRPANPSIASSRGNKPFDWCRSGCTTPAYPGAAPDTAQDSDVFMPPAEVRGDIARSIFYMATRYNGEDEGTVNLLLSNCPNPSYALMGKLTTLLEWHSADPPDDLERRRNDLICSDYQGNRNPFIDFPDLVGKIYCGYEDPVPQCAAGLIPPICGGQCSDIGGLKYADTQKEALCSDLVKAKYCEFSLIVRERCRASCNMCSSPICQDSEPSGLIWDDTGEDASCSEIAEFCDIDFVLDSCPETCGACTGIKDLPVPDIINPEDPPPKTTAVPLPAGNEDNQTFVIVLISVAGFCILSAGVASVVVFRRRRKVLLRQERVRTVSPRSSFTVSSGNPQFESP